MLRECATIVIINMEEQRNHGIVLMISYMLLECAKIVTLIAITEKKGNKKSMSTNKWIN